ncbi:glycosyltransferase family 1 protein [Corynebacterium sp. Q4381]|uniref:glycosyltransferase family 1 protein n=1 Tax=Corynebacterium sp. Marseille-Q4381 TaxID=3121597 RepID=UPI002FE672C6
MKHLIIGPDGHGVTDYALKLAAACGAETIREERFSGAELPDEPIHVAFTDNLCDTDALIERVGARPLSVSFHDVPQPEEGKARYARRAAAYRRLADAAQLNATNSNHEARFFGGDAAVIRLPIPVIDSPFAPEAGTVGVLGFLYPGKGHEDVIEALAGTNWRMRFLGAVSDGHEEWAAGLARHAEITGWLTDEQMAVEMGRIAVPVCAHRHFSASGSMMAWLGAGRTILARDSDYAREIDDWLPGRIQLVDGPWRPAIKDFEPRVVDPPAYGWADVARAWEDAWTSAGLV